jgi:hypothetical protein
MITYPIVLKSQPQQENVLHRFEIVEGKTEGNGFELISTWLKLPSTKNPTDVCPLCEAVCELPDGSLEAHLKKYQAEHGGRDAFVRIVYRHKGPALYSRPPGRTVVTDATKVISLKDYVRILESSSQAPSSDIP